MHDAARYNEEHGADDQRARHEFELRKVEPPSPAKPAKLYNMTAAGQSDLNAAWATFTAIDNELAKVEGPRLVALRLVGAVSISFLGVQLQLMPLRHEPRKLTVWHVKPPGHQGGAYVPSEDAPAVTVGQAAQLAALRTAQGLRSSARDQRRRDRWDGLVDVLSATFAAVADG